MKGCGPHWLKENWKVLPGDVIEFFYNECTLHDEDYDKWWPPKFYVDVIFLKRMLKKVNTIQDKKKRKRFKKWAWFFYAGVSFPLISHYSWIMKGK